MHSRRPTTLIVTLAALALLALPPAAAWSNGGYSADVEDPDYGTHDWIADMALAAQTEDVSFLATTYHTEFLLGTEAPDNPDFIGDSIEHHVYYYSGGGLQDDSSADRASAMYGLALARLEAGEFSVAAYYTGAMTHYISDVGVFGHTMGAYTDWGAEVHHSDYEAEFEDMLDTLDAPTGTDLGDSGAYEATLALARDVTFGAGDIEPNVWMDYNYDWSDPVFRDSAVASLHAAVAAVASAVNHLIIEAAEEPEPEETTVPGAPSSLEAYILEGKVVLTWSAPESDGGAPVIEYQVSRATGSSGTAVVGTTSSLVLTWTDENVEEGASYTYIVRARNSAGLSEPSQAATATVPDSEGGSYLLQMVVVALAATLATGGAVSWRRSRRRGRR